MEMGFAITKKTRTKRVPGEEITQNTLRLSLFAGGPRVATKQPSLGLLSVVTTIATAVFTTWLRNLIT